LAVEKQIENVNPKGPFTLDRSPREPDERFFSFQAIGVWTQEPGSAVIGSYSVNRKTADVWDMSSCEVIEFPKLFEVQTKYRIRIGSGKEQPSKGPNSYAKPSLC